MDENPYEAPQAKLVDPPRSRRRMANLIDRALLVVLAVLLFFGILDVLSVLVFFRIRGCRGVSLADRIHLPQTLMDENPYEAPQEKPVDRPRRLERRKAALRRQRVRIASYVAGEAGKVVFLLACAIVLGVAIVYLFLLPPIQT
jgi:hypothetical protein